MYSSGLSEWGGGSIYIVTDLFLNDGTINAEPNGRIYIICKEYANNGVIQPKPTIIKPNCNADVLIEYFMHCLVIESELIHRKEDFYRRIGIILDSNWFEQIVNHKMLFKNREFEEIGMRHLESIGFDDVDVDGLQEEDSMMAPYNTESAPGPIHSEKSSTASSTASSRPQSRRGSWAHGDFVKTMDAINQSVLVPEENKNFWAEQALQMALESLRTSPKAASVSSIVAMDPPTTVIARLGYELDIDFFRFYLAICDKMIFHAECGAIMLKSDAKRTEKESFQIESSAGIAIISDVLVEASQVALNWKTARTRFVTKATFTNEGRLSCNGVRDGDCGAIHCVADLFVNDGEMECFSNSRAKIRCRSLINNGLIQPGPDIEVFESLADMFEDDEQHSETRILGRKSTMAAQRLEDNKIKTGDRIKMKDRKTGVVCHLDEDSQRVIMH